MIFKISRNSEGKGTTDQKVKIWTPLNPMQLSVHPPVALGMEAQGSWETGWQGPTAQGVSVSEADMPDDQPG